MFGGSEDGRLPKHPRGEETPAVSGDPARVAASRPGSFASNPRPAKPASQRVSKKERIEVCLKRILEQDDIPMFSGQIHQLMSFLANDNASLDRLANVVLQNYGLTLAILRRANSALHNRSRSQVCTVSRALALMGVDVVRYLATSMVFLDHFQKKSRAVAELMLVSLLTANTARNVALRLHIRNDEEVYLCGMFRNLGKVLVACYLPKQYERILKEGEDGTLSEYNTVHKILRFSYEDLGKAMALHWNLPNTLHRVMEPPGLSSRPKKDRSEDIVAKVVAFSHEVGTALFRGESARAHPAVDVLVKHTRDWLNLQPHDVQSLLLKAILDTQDVYTSFGDSLDRLRLCQRLQTSLFQLESQKWDL